MTERVLIVEDERASRRALVALLEGSGYEVHGVGTAEEALAVIRGDKGERQPDVALVDIDLPGMDGIELSKRIAAMAPLVLSIFITASEGERVSALERRNKGQFMRKPLDFDRLLRLLNQPRGGRVGEGAPAN